MKTVKSVGTPSKTFSELDLELPSLPQTVAAKIKQDVGEYIVEQVLMDLSKATTPVSGETFKPLSKEYAKEKKALGLSPKPDMTLEGDMLDALTFEPSDKGIRVGFFGSEAWKADGHLHFSPESENARAPKRRFLPGEGQKLKPEIQKEIERIIQDAILANNEPTAKELDQVETKKDLYGILIDALGDYTRKEIRQAVLRNDSLVTLLADKDLLDLL